MPKYQIGYIKESMDGSKFVALKHLNAKTDVEVEAEVDALCNCTPLDDEGIARTGLYIRRGDRRWFRRFSHHVYISHPKRSVG